MNHLVFKVKEELSVFKKIDHVTILKIFEKITKNKEKQEDSIVITSGDLQDITPDKISHLKLGINLSNKKWNSTGTDGEDFLDDE